MYPVPDGTRHSRQHRAWWRWGRWDSTDAAAEGMDRSSPQRLGLGHSRADLDRIANNWTWFSATAHADPVAGRYVSVLSPGKYATTLVFEKFNPFWTAIFFDEWAQNGRHGIDNCLLR